MKNNNEKKRKISRLVKEMLKQSHTAMVSHVEKILNSGCIDIDTWDGQNAIIPKAIVTALLQAECTQFDASGTSYARTMKKEVRNIRYFL